MRKIKGLKVPLRYYDIERRAKKIVNLSEEKEYNSFLKQTVSSIVSTFDISLLYDTFEIEKDDVFNTIVNRKKTNYVSCGFFTLGNGVDRDRLNEEIEKKIFDIVVDIHSKTALEVIKDLIREEAKKERLSVEEIIIIYEPNSIKEQKVFEKIVSVINLENTLITYNDGRLNPFYSWAFLVPWVSSKK